MARAPRNRPASVERHVVRGVLYLVVALILAVVGLATGEIVVFVVLGVPAIWLARRGVRHLKRRYDEETALEGIGDVDGDGEADWVVYLRPFDRDGKWDGATAFTLYDPRTWRKLPISPSNLRTLYLEMTGRNSFAGVLRHVTRQMGELVVIGEPGSPPILGARNVYVGDDDWQQVVLQLARNSRLIVVTAGVSEGVMWEVQSILAGIPADRVVLRVPGSTRSERRQQYEEFAAKAAEHFPSGLPETLGGARFLLFDDGWIPAAPTGRFARAEKNTTGWVVKRLNQMLA